MTASVKEKLRRIIFSCVLLRCNKVWLRMSPRKHDRSDDQTAISISLPKELREAIDAAAKADKRKRSNWIVTQLEAILDKIEDDKKGE